METGLDILQKLPSRYPGLFDGAFHLSGRVIRNFTGHAAEPGLFCRRIIESLCNIFERPALHHAQLVPEPFRIFRVHLRELLD